MKFDKILIKAFTICLCCVFAIGVMSYISPPLETHAENDISSHAVTDLTNTTWYIPSGWSATSGLGKFNIDWSSETAGSGSIFAVGYNIESYTKFVTEANKITFGTGVPLLAIGNTYEFTVTFTGGTDVTNPKLIAWLTKYGVLQGSEDPAPEEIVTTTPSTPTGFVGFYQDIIFPSLNGLGDTSSIKPVGIARLNGEIGIIIGTTAYSGLVLWTQDSEYTTFYPWYSLQNNVDENVNVLSGDLILSALTTDGGLVDVAIIKPYNKGTANTYIYINTAHSSSFKQSMTAYDEVIYYLGADGGGITSAEYSYVEVDVENRTYTIPTVADEDAYNTWALFQRLNSQWFAEINSYNFGVSSEFGENLIIDTLKAPFSILDSFTLFVVNGTAITLAHIFGALIGLSLFFLFLKLFAGG